MIMECWHDGGDGPAAFDLLCLWKHPSESVSEHMSDGN